jgi:Chaperone of endosialidase
MAMAAPARAQWTWSTPDVYLSTSTDSVGIGTSSPNEQLEITGNLRLPATTSNPYGVIYSGGDRFIHNYGLYNQFFGEKSGNLSMTGARNTVVGYSALFNNTTGSYNTAMGYSSLWVNSSGSYNSALGYNVLYYNTTGSDNSAMGYTALENNTTGNDNTAMGYDALGSNTAGDDNSAIGYDALGDNIGGSDNTAIGYEALSSNTHGDHNSSVGYYALGNNTTGNFNSALGSIALLNNTTGIYNVALGHEAGYNNQTGSNNVFMGYQAGYNEMGSDKLYIANSSTDTLIYGDFSLTRVGIGTSSPNEQLEITGNFRMPSTTSSTGIIYAGANRFIHNYGTDNTALGINAGNFATTGQSITAVGAGALESNTTGDENSAVGCNALADNTTGVGNSALGYYANHENTTGDHNVALGYYAMRNNTTGNYNSALGYQALNDNVTGLNNTAIGNDAGYNNETGSTNVFIGNAAGYYERGSEKLYIANSSGTPLIYGDFSATRLGIDTTTPATALDVNGVVTATGGTSTNWNTAYSERRQWDGSSSNLNAGTGRTSLGLGSVQNIDVQSFWSQLAGQYIGSEEIRARDGSGLKLYDDGGNGLFVEDGGQVGIGLVDPSRALHLQGHNAVFRMDRDVNTAGFLFVRTAPGDFNTIWKTYHVGGRASGVDTGEFIIDDLGTEVSGDGTRLLTINNSGNWAIGTQSPTEKLDVQGNVIADDYFYHSSRELKREITPLSPADCARMLDKVEAIEVCRYRYKSGGEDGPVKLGMIAEDAPEEIRSADGKAIRMTDTVGMLLAAVKAQSQEIRELRAEIDLLKERDVK